MTLWHYTCEHSFQLIGLTGLLLPTARQVPDRDGLPWTAQLCWMTDLRAPIVDVLGLTRHFITCDRTAYRYRVVDESDVVPYVDYARRLTRAMRDDVELGEGNRPMHWYVSTIGVPIVFDPAEAAAAS